MASGPGWFGAAPGSAGVLPRHRPRVPVRAGSVDGRPQLV